jgi:hypothetical protein
MPRRLMRATLRDLVVPPQPAPQHRAPIGLRTLHACFAAHLTDAHAGQQRLACPTCSSYVAALTDELATQPAEDPNP